MEILQLPLKNAQKQCLIEASAGTGKTYTIAALYLQLLAQNELTVDQILVVTFTKAATAELRQRIRQGIVKLLQSIDKESDEPLFKQIVLSVDDQQALKYRLQVALQDFDQSAIMTIHGFCQRILQDYAFLTGQRFDLDIVDSEQEILDIASQDYWRQMLTEYPLWWLQFFLTQYSDPKALLTSIKDVVDKPWAKFVEITPNNTSKNIRPDLQKQWDLVKDCWIKHASDISDLLIDGRLNANKYKKKSVAQWVNEMHSIVREGSLPLSLFDRADKFTDTELISSTNKGKTTPHHVFFELFENFYTTYQQFIKCVHQEQSQLRQNFCLWLREQLPARKIQQGIASFDDLLIRVQQILVGEQSSRLEAALRHQYRAALIDEFQDTDPLQYQIFSKLFKIDTHTLYFVGDPKQAIYRFRGADIYAYLTAADSLEQRYSLQINWRSSPQMLAASNQLFSLVEQPFDNEKIAYPTAKPNPDYNKKGLLVREGSQAALQLWHQPDKMNVADANHWCVKHVAAEIARLLWLSQEGDATIEERAVKASDIAVLVQTHIQANLIKKALLEEGIRCSTQGQQSIYDTTEAYWLQLLLAAVIQPQSSRRVFSFLSLPWMRLDAEKLFEMNHSEGFSYWFSHLDQAKGVCINYGIVAMYQYLDEQWRLSEKAKQMIDGERCLTNIRQLLMLLQDQTRKTGYSPQKLHDWLAQQRQLAERDQTLMQLESDEQLVKVVTIHSSKGLEFPIVFCPFLWKGQSSKSKGRISNAIYHQNGETLIDLGSDTFGQALAMQKKDIQQEQLRLLYVAVTRSVYRCYLTWGKFNTREHSSLGHFLGKDDEGLEQLSVHQTDVIDVFEPIIANRARALVKSSYLDCQPRKHQHKPDKPKRMTSFSALSATAGHVINIERPDYDFFSDDTEQLSDTLDAFSFPRGANAGTCLHEIFEYWDFNCEDINALKQLVQVTLVKYGIDDNWTEVATDMVWQVLNTPLHDGNVLLSSLPTSKRLVEMSFSFPVKSLDIDSLKLVLMRDYAKNNASRMLAVQSLDFGTVSGYMKGFIDLLIEVDGLYYVLDYKSNYLGNNDDAYDNSAMEAAILQHHYYFQYLIYMVALHRFLKWHIPDYQYETHIGGIHYLFIRGMGRGQGDYFDCPDFSLIVALDRLFEGDNDVD